MVSFLSNPHPCLPGVSFSCLLLKSFFFSSLVHLTLCHLRLFFTVYVLAISWLSRKKVPPGQGFVSTLFRAVSLKPGRESVHSSPSMYIYQINEWISPWDKKDYSSSDSNKIDISKYVFSKEEKEVLTKYKFWRVIKSNRKRMIILSETLREGDSIT